LALNELSVDLLPDVDSPNLVVRTDWQGAMLEFAIEEVS
jgi:multidrug efflux pump subunit AcrB